MSYLERLEDRRLLAAVSIRGDEFYINGNITHPTSQLEGSLPNVRAVNATFDDANPATQARWKYPTVNRWDANRNTAEFVAQLPAWRSAGILAATLSFQGGGPVDKMFGANQQWNNTAYNADGSLKQAYLGRMETAIRALDSQGMVAFVNLFYLGQESRLRDSNAVLKAAENATKWLTSKGFKNVVIDAVNESSSQYRYSILEPQSIHNLLRQIKGWSGNKLLVGTSFLGGVLPSSQVVAASDLIFLHGNGQNSAKINQMVDTMRGRTGKPIVFNEDSTNLANFREATKNDASWGYYDQGKNNYNDGFQSVPVRWTLNTNQKKAFAAEVRRLSQPTNVAPTVNSASFALDSLPQTLGFVFSESVGSSITAGDLVVRRLTDMQVVTPTSVQYAAATHTFHARFSTPLADGDYQARLNKNGVFDAQGMPLAADYVFDFPFLAGDANGDRVINVGDFAIMGLNFNAPAAYRGGDFDYSGHVDIGDFSILASKFNASLLGARNVTFNTTAVPPTVSGRFSVRRLIDQLE
jgi:hypothetical protein